MLVYKESLHLFQGTTCSIYVLEEETLVMHYDSYTMSHPHYSESSFAFIIWAVLQLSCGLTIIMIMELYFVFVNILLTWE